MFTIVTNGFVGFLFLVAFKYQDAHRTMNRFVKLGELDRLLIDRRKLPFRRFEMRMWFASLSFAGVFLTGVNLNVDVQQAMTRRPASDWPMYNRDLAGTRYSPLMGRYSSRGC